MIASNPYTQALLALSTGQDNQCETLNALYAARAALKATQPTGIYVHALPMVEIAIEKEERRVSR